MRRVVKAYLQEPLTQMEMTMDEQLATMSCYQIDSYTLEYLFRGMRVRTALARMIHDLAKGDVLVIYKMTMMGDSFERIGTMLHQIYERGANLILMKEAVDTTGMTYLDIYALMEAYYQHTPDQRERERINVEELVRLKALYNRSSLPMREIVQMFNYGVDKTKS